MRSYVRVDWETEFATLTSITSYRNTEIDWTQDLAGLPTPPFILQVTNIWEEEDEQVTQELRLSGDSDSGDLNWVAGIYYSEEEIDRNEEFIRSTPSNPIFDQFNEATSYAVFGQFTYSLTEDLNLTLGGRYTRDEKDIDLAVVDGSNGTAPSLAPATETYAISTDDSWTAFTPKATLDYAIGEDSMVYFSVAEGYKSGGYQAAPADALSAETSFDPEFARNYELGAKTQWFDNRLRANVTGFYMDYEDLQVLQLVSVPDDLNATLLITENAANATSKGIELELLAVPLAGLEVGGSYSWLDAAFDEYITAKGADLSGNSLRRSPRNSYDVFVRYEMEMSDGGNLAFRTSYQYKGLQYFENNNFRVSREDGFGLFDASIKYLSADESWDVSLWGKNLGDELYRTNSITVRDSGFARIGPPTTWGLAFSKRFGS